MTVKESLFLNRLKEKPLLPLFYHDNVEVCISITKACLESGLKVIEFVNRGIYSKKNFEILRKYLKEHGEIQLGAGSIKGIQDAKDFIDLGADFIVTPYLDKKVGKLCKRNSVHWVPGCGSLSEMIKAEKYGAELIKLFPGSVYGPKFISSVMGPCPWLKIMPTGGVSTEKENIESWIRSGAYCLGMGSKLFPKKLISGNSSLKLESHIKSVLKKIISIEL